MKNNPPIVISIGGSMVVPKTGIDVAYLEAFRTLLMKEIKKGKRFILVVGGGATAREYQNAANAIVRIDSEDVDWLGIHATRMNGHLLRTLFRDVANKVVVKDPTRNKVWHEPVLVAAGWKPGWSTDYIAVRMAKKYGASQIINLTNVARVYDKDPAKHADAVPFDAMNWKQFREIVGDVWVPGANAPFDPIASKFADRHGMEVIIAAGGDLANVKNILDQKKFIGTRLAHHL